MTDHEKIHWAARAFDELAKDCELISELPVVDHLERRTWISVAEKARRNARIMEQ